MNRRYKKPYYPLKDVKKLIKSRDFIIRRKAISSAIDDFDWSEEKIEGCLLNLNDRYHLDDCQNNHFFETKTNHPITDCYKVKNIIEDRCIWTNLCILDVFTRLVVYEFKELR